MSVSCKFCRAWSVVAGCLLSVLPGCSPDRPPAPGAHAQVINTYSVTGVVQALDSDGLTARIRHQAIPGYMEAMTMPFKARESAALASVRTNDHIEFRLNVTGTESWIDQVRVSRDYPAPAPIPVTPSTRVVRDVEPLAEGDVMTDYTFTTELGRPVSLASFRGSAIAFTFIYTRCPLPDFCPRMSNHFSETAAKLAARPTGPTNWHFLSISFDVEHDTPPVLRQYAARFKHDPARWDFATGRLADIDAITEQFGLQMSREQVPFNWNHNLRTIVVDAQGKVQKIFIGNTWTPDQLLEEMVKAAQTRS